MAGVFFFLHFEVNIALQLSRNLFGFGILCDVVMSQARNDQRGSGFVDQNVVDFVDNRVGQLTLHLLFCVHLHVVAQVIETEFIVRAVGDVAGVCGLAIFGRHIGLDGTDCQTQTHVQRTHPFHVALSQIVIHRDDVDGPGKCVQERWQRSDQRLPFTRCHFGDHPLMKDVTTDHLNVVMTHLQIALARFANRGERFRKQHVQGFAIRQPSTHFGGGFAKFSIAQFFQIRFQSIDSIKKRTGKNHRFPVLVARKSNIANSSFVRRTENVRDEPFSSAQYPIEGIADFIQNFHDSSVE